MTIKDRIQMLDEDAFEPLKKIYASVPSGSCKGCTACCSESVNISFLEFSNIIRNGLLKLEPDKRLQLNKNIISYYLTEWIKPRKCPFLDLQGLCVIYDVRPLPCRMFGTATKSAYEKNYRQIQVQNLKVAKWLAQNEKIMLPLVVRNKKINFCEDFIPERTLETEEIQQRYDQLINLDGQLFFKGVIDDSFMNENLVNLSLLYLISESAENETMEKLYEMKCEMTRRLT